MKKQIISIVALLIGTLGALAAEGDMQQSLPSNWGGWQNLTYGITDATYESTAYQPMQVEVSGNTIHLLWFENSKDADGLYRMYYRRSADLGRTWEAAQVVGTSHEPQPENGGNQYQWMAVSGNTVHIIALDNDGYFGANSVNYVRSTDGGKTFTTRTLRQKGSGNVSPHIAADGQTVALAFSEYHGGGDYQQRVISSLDGGTTFNDTLIQTRQLIADLKVQGSRWALMGYTDGSIYVTTSTDGGRHYTTTNIAHKDASGKTHAGLWTPFSLSHMSMDGDNINVVYRGSLSNGGDGDADVNDWMHTIFQRSTDGGQTWQEPIYLEGTCGIEPNTVVGRGNDIYVYTCTGSGADSYHGRDAHPTLFYSHDGGKTWATQTRVFDVFRPGIPRLTIDPKDSQHVIFTGQRAFYLESKDGFRTVSKNFLIGWQAFISRNGNNNALQTLIDSEGNEHWFMHYSAPDPAKADYEGTPWHIVYRRVERPAAPGSTNMAFDIAKPANEPDNKAINPAYIPMTPSLEAAAEAITVECWVRPDSKGFLVIGLNNENEGDGHDRWYDGFSIHTGQTWEGKLVFSASIHPEKTMEGTTIEGGMYVHATNTWGLWHHVAMTYDSKVASNNFRLYVDGMLIGTKTDAGRLLMTNKAICIGRVDQASDEDQAKGLIDNLAIYSRALTAGEIREHLYNTPNAQDKDCRLLLTFDGTLRDLSQYQNDAVPLTPNILTETDPIRPPHPEFTLTKDMTGQKVYANDVTQDGEACWWLMTNKDYPVGDPSTSDKRHISEDYSGHPGTYSYWMIARGDGKTTNACATTFQTITVGGLTSVTPEKAGNVPDVKLRIQGGYELTYSNKPRVLLKQGSTEIEGTWDVDYDYDASKIVNSDNLAPATFNLWNAPVGTYDVIVGNDTLRQAFTVEQREEPDVWIQINGREKLLFNKYQSFSIDYGNRSNVAAYNTPVFIAIPDRKGTVDVHFDFDYDLYSDAFDDEQLKMARQLGEYLMTYDEATGDSIRIYSFFIPYIAPNSTHQVFFRFMCKGDSGLDGNFRICYMAGEPWGPWTDDDGTATTRAVDDEFDSYLKDVNKGRSKAECALTMFGMSFIETGLTVAPIVGCTYNVAKTITQKFWGKDKSWSNFGTNFITAAFACGSDLFPPSLLVKAGFAVGKLIWDMVSNKAAYDACIKGDPNWKDNLLVYSYDPNEMIGPWGPDDNAHYIQPIHQMPYMITFENKATATAPANEVFVTDTLDLTKLDAETFSFNGFGWADTTFTVGGSRTQEFSRDVIYTVNGHEMLVRVTGQFSPATGIAHWSFVSLEKNGNELDDIMNGFLLPNDGTGRGEGFVSFSIEHKPNPASGSTISNKATIVFDANAPITTNTYVNTFDTDYPTSKVTKAEEKDGQMIVTIQGSDATSGIGTYTVYASKNGGEWEAVAIVAGGTTATFACAPGTRYALCALATDNAGWLEPKSLKAELTLTTGGTQPEQPTTINVVTAAAGYATFYDSEKNYQLPTGLTARVVSGVSGDRLSYQTLSGNIIPKGTAVLLEGAQKQAATYTLTSTTADASYTGNNLLHGSDVVTTTSATGQNLYYKLTYGPSGTSLAQSFGWFWGARNGAAFSIDGHRAWLAVPAGSAATRGFLISGEATGISDLTTDTDGSPLRDLQGRPAAQSPQKGIYVRGGRKVVIK